MDLAVWLKVGNSLDMMRKKVENVIRIDEQISTSANNDMRVFKNCMESFNLKKDFLI